MKIAFCTRSDYDKPLGGDAVQLLKTKEYLEKQFDIKVLIVTDPELLDQSFDLIHIFNFSVFRVTRTFINKAKDLGKPVVASSIYWDYSYAMTQNLCKLLGYGSFLSARKMNILRFCDRLLAVLFNKPTYISRRFRSNLRYFIDSVDLILPNSIEEAKLLYHFAGISGDIKFAKNFVVHNAVEIKDYEILDENVFFEKYAIPRGYILQVGRIEYVKNQLNLIYALMRRPEIPLVFIGYTSDTEYMKALKRVAERRGNVFFLSEVKHEDIYSFYYYAKVHVLLSLRESPGLVSLEALSQGCPIVVADHRFAPIRTYFGQEAFIVDPLNEESIYNGVLAAYEQKCVCEKDLSEFSWNYAARQTMDAYKLLIKK